MKSLRFAPHERARKRARALTHFSEWYSLPYDDAHIVLRHKPTGNIKTIVVPVKYGHYPLLRSWD